MAVARPIRVLGAACILLMLFLVFEVTRPFTPQYGKLEGMKRDPLLDRKESLSLLEWRMEKRYADYTKQLESLQAYYSEPKTKTIPQRAPIPPGSMQHYSF
jgi:mannosyltransferase